DGKTLAMICSGGQQVGRLEIASFDGVNIGPRTVLVDGQLCAAPVWSPDGNGIAYFAPVGPSGHFQLFYLPVLPAPTPTPLALARAISLAEDRDPQATALVANLQGHVGHAHLVGLTGPPGSGKSTLADGLVKMIRANGRTVGVLAVDPSSPFTGGAVLGDRVRMSRHTLDKGVFIRSMGARGHLGGLAAATREAIHLLDASGRDVIVVETVGVGQSELEI